jgi:hypothetical protein
MRIRTGVAGLSLGILLAACGAGPTTTVTRTQTQTVTRTVVRHLPARPARGTRGGKSSSGRSFASTYPPAFAAKFRAKCLHGGNGSSYCGCLLHHIEKRVPFTVVVTERRAIFGANPPSWLSKAEDACFTP